MKLITSRKPAAAAFMDDFMALWPEVGPMPQHKAASEPTKPAFVRLFRREAPARTA